MKVPFTTAQFFEVIEKYNLGVFPAQLVLLILGIVLLYMVHSKYGFKNRFIMISLAFLWIWMGAVYHLAFFTAINPAAWIFGSFFILQGIIFLIVPVKSKGIEFSFKGGAWDYTGYFFILFGLVIYPILIFFLEGSLKTTIVLGLPCPTTILTFGFILLAGHRIPWYVIVIPVLWALIGTSAAFQFGVYPDYLLIVAAVVTVVFALVKRDSGMIVVR